MRAAAVLLLLLAQTTAPSVVLPVLVKSTRPVYPEKELKEKVTGVVVIAILIDDEGKVADTDVVSSPGEAFSKAADACVRQWRFRPGKKDGRAAAFKQTVTIDFKLKEPPPPAKEK